MAAAVVPEIDPLENSLSFVSRRPQNTSGYPDKNEAGFFRFVAYYIHQTPVSPRQQYSTDTQKQR
jgi:hypothetical protein